PEYIKTFGVIAGQNNFTNLKICKDTNGEGCINWDFLNISYIDLSDENLALEGDFVSLNTSDAGAIQLNKSANITINTSSCDSLAYYNASSFPENRTEILTTGTTFTPSYSTCSNNLATFSVDHFSGYAVNYTITESSCDVYCGSCGECDIAVDTPNRVVCLNQNITNTTNTCIDFEADNVTLDGQDYSIIGGPASGGTQALSQTNITVQNCIYYNQGHDFAFVNDSELSDNIFYGARIIVGGINLVIYNNTFENHDEAVITTPSGSNNITISNNHINNITLFGGIVAYDSENVYVYDNFICNINGYGVYIDSNYTEVSRNEFCNLTYAVFTNDDPYHMEVNNNSIYNTSWSSIVLNQAHNVTLDNNVVDLSSDSGMLLGNSDNITASNNNISRADNSGVFSYYSSDVTITNNWISNATLQMSAGVYVRSGQNINVSSNVVNQSPIALYTMIVQHNDNTTTIDNNSLSMSKIGLVSANSSIFVGDNNITNNEIGFFNWELSPNAVLPTINTSQIENNTAAKAMYAWEANILTRNASSGLPMAANVTINDIYGDPNAMDMNLDSMDWLLTNASGEHNPGNQFVDDFIVTKNITYNNDTTYTLTPLTFTATNSTNGYTGTEIITIPNDLNDTMTVIVDMSPESVDNYTINVTIDGEYSTVFNQTAQPYEVTFHAENNGLPLVNETLFVIELNGNNLFVPVTVNNSLNRALSYANTDENGNITFIITPTHYPTIPDYELYALLNVDGDVVANATFSITNNASLSFTDKPITPSSLSDNIKVVVNSLVSLADSLFYWTSTIEKANFIEVSAYTNSSISVSGTLQTGAPNVITVYLNESNGTAVNGTLDVHESSGYLMFNPSNNPETLTNKSRRHTVDANTAQQFIIVPTEYAGISTDITLSVYNSTEDTVAQTTLSINTTLVEQGDIPGNAQTYINDTLKTRVNSIVSVADHLFAALN
ncbi:right-handed parallel beta-helix repeat-containing protein, partial [Candidatus Peregrinibacteria bacterium]|nr:right-handed parallel beta-helix repeat-containing protein [Candidatus Peregrinibacteria bacterium]